MRAALFVLRSAPRARWFAAIATVLGLCSGIGRAVVIAEINRLHTGERVHAAAIIALCVIAASTRSIGEYLLASVSSSLVRDLRVRLCKKIVGLPLRDQEMRGAAPVFA